MSTIEPPVETLPPEPLGVPPSQTPYKEQPHGPVGQRCERVDGPEKVLGTALYGADLMAREADLFARVVRSGYAHAEILSIDATEALKVPGVLGVYTHRDVPGTNRQGLIKRDHPVLAERAVLYRGDAVALVVTEAERVLGDACAAVKVEYKPLPVVATMDEALMPGAPLLHPDGNVMGGKRIRKGDAEAALAGADVVVEDTFETQTVDHAFLDLEAGIARWDGATLTIHASGQWVHEERRLVALALGLPLESVRICQPATGGAFGGREDISIQIYLGLAAMKHPNKTVAMRYSREESMRARHKRHALRIHYSLGARSDGTLTAAKVVVYSEEGAYASTGPAVIRKAASHATGPYRVPNVHVDVYGVHTNNNPTGAMRGFGAAQMAIAYEGMIDRLAAKLGMDRVELRRRNLIGPGDEVTTGQRIPEPTAQQCMQAVLDRAGVVGGRASCTPSSAGETPAPHGVAARGRLSGSQTPPTLVSGSEAPPTLVSGSQTPPAPPHLRRGWGLSVICFGLGYGDGFPDASRARVRLADDGLVEVYTGGVEYGQGLLTVMSQIAAEELGVPLAQTRIIWADTQRTHESGSSSASRQTYFTGNAVRLAASELREQVLDVAGAFLRIHPHEIEIRDGIARNRYDPNQRVPLHELAAAGRRRGYSLEATGLFKPRTICEDFETGQSPRAFITYLFGAHLAQVLVDIETGEVRVERHIACHDVGRAINPQSVDGQITGGVAQGIGMALMEEVVMHEGRMLNPGFTDYILPTIRDVPPVEAIVLEHDDAGGPFGARGVGEPPLIGAVPAVLSAIADAIGRFPRKTPCTPERVWEMINGK
jgi:CO/xanthine dehydrogenase Mo-binding subunit